MARIKPLTDYRREMDEELRKLICKGYCQDKNYTAIQARDALIGTGYSRVMAEKLVNKWAGILQRNLPFNVAYIKGSAL